MFQRIKPDQYQPDTPEYRLASFLACWQAGNYEGMVEDTQMSWRATVKDPRHQLTMFFSHKKIERLQVINRLPSKMNADVFVELDAMVEFRVPMKRKQRLQFRRILGNVIRENEEGSPDPNGRWGVNPTSALREK